MTTTYHEPNDLIFIQSRAEVDQAIIEEYAQMMVDGVGFDPALAISDGSKIYVYDGYHRGEAARKAGQLLFVAVRPGTREEAEWLALGANQKHGLRRTNQDKQRVIRLALAHPAGAKLSNREIARHCGVDDKTVGKLRGEMEASAEIPQIETRTVTRGEQTYEVNTARIGPKQEAPDDASEWPTGLAATEDSQTEWLEEAPAIQTPPPPAVQPQRVTAPPPPAPKAEEGAPPPPPPPPPAPKPAAPPDWHLHVTLKSTGLCLVTLTQAGQVEPVKNISTHVTELPTQVEQALAAHVPNYPVKETI